MIANLINSNIKSNKVGIRSSSIFSYIWDTLHSFDFVWFTWIFFKTINIFKWSI